MTTTQENARPQLTLGWRLQMAMKHADLTALDMAGEMEVSRDTVARWIHDETQPHKFFLQAWATRTGVDYDWLVGTEVAATDPKTARGTGESAGRGPITDNKSSAELRRERPARRRRDRSSYPYCRRHPRLPRTLTHP